MIQVTFESYLNDVNKSKLKQTIYWFFTNALPQNW